jgi:hypothetical protein
MTKISSSTRHHLSFLANFLTDTLYLPTESKTQQARSQYYAKAYKKEANEPTTRDSGSHEDQVNTINESQEAYPQTKNLNQDTKESSDHSGSINYYGGYQQRILVLVNQPSSSPLIPKERLVLENILGAVNLSFSDVAVVNISQKADLTSHDILEEFNPTQLLGFGLPEDFLRDQPPPYQLATMADSCSIVTGDPLSMIAAQKSLKVKLWQSLKQLFSLT